MSDCSLRSRGSRFEAAAFLSHSHRRRACLLVRSSRTAARDPGPRWIRRCRRRSQWKERLCSLRVNCSLRSLRLALFSRCLPHSLADEMHVCSLTRPGQRRARPAEHGRRAIGRSQPCSWLLGGCQRPAGVRPSGLPSRPRPRLMKVSASEVRARAAGWSGSVSTSGTPSSPAARSCGSSGICASRETG
jgi:hypothetical protein